MSKSSVVLEKVRCPKCAERGEDNSGDNLVVYENGGKHCFNPSCNYTVPSEDYREDVEQIFEHEDKLEYSVANWQKLKTHTVTEGGGYRGISDETYAFYGVRHQYDAADNLVEQIYPLTNTQNEICGVKFRNVDPKKFYVKGSNKAISTELFGQSVHRKSKSDTILLASGEADAMAAHEMLKNLGYKMPAIVSSTIGEDGATQFKAQYEFFNKFDRIVVVPDNDKAGKKALEKLSLVLPRGKLFVVELPRKDTNDMLIDGLESDFVARYMKAKPHVPEGIVGSGSLREALLESINVKKIPLPPFMHVLEDMLAGGISLETIVNLVAASGIGKSSYANELTYYWIFNSPYKVGIYSLELSAGQYANVLLSRHIEQKISLLRQEEQMELLESDKVQAQTKELLQTENGQDRFYLLEDRGGTLEQAKAQIEKLIIGCDCKVIIIDPLQDLFAGCSFDEEAQFMTWQKVMIKVYKIVFINICHTRKSSDDSNVGSTGAMISEESIQGSSAIYKSASINLLLTRNKLAENPMDRNTTKMWLSKNRSTGITGPCGELIYNNKNHKLYDSNDYKELFPGDFAEEAPDNMAY